MLTESHALRVICSGIDWVNVKGIAYSPLPKDFSEWYDGMTSSLLMSTDIFAVATHLSD